MSRPRKKTPTAKLRKSRNGANRSYLSQADVPSYSLEQALRVPTAIVESYGGHPVTPLQLAEAMMVQPTSGPFRQLCGASIAYGLTKGGYNAQQISLDLLGRQILKPQTDDDETSGKREAMLRPRVMREFLRRYDSSPLPRKEIAHNVLEEMGVPANRVSSVFDLVIDGAQSVGFIRDIKGKLYVDVSAVKMPPINTEDDGDSDELCQTEQTDEISDRRVEPPSAENQGISRDNRRVYVTHGKNRDFLEPIKKLLSFGEMTAVISVERPSVSKPVPYKVMDDMRNCGAAIIHVDDEQRLIDQSANEHVIINPNVLIEIGAAMALYGQRFILLVRDGVSLPSNLSGLYEVRYNGDSLDGEATIRLLEAINNMKGNPIPARQGQSNGGDAD